MILPENGRVVVIDDNIEEVAPLIEVLSKNGIPVSYFSGMKAKFLPSKKLEGVRVIFIDIVLGEKGADKTDIAKAANVIIKIISPRNGPYLLIAWTKHDDLIEGLKDRLSECKPAITLNLEKSDYFESSPAEGGELKYTPVTNAFKLIETNLKEALKSAGAINLFFIWENLLHRAGGNIVSDFSSFYPLDNNWNKNLSSVIKQLAKAYAGDNLDGNNIAEVAKNALLTFDNAFIDALENKVELCQELKEIAIDCDAPTVDSRVCANINSRLLLDVKVSRKAEPGNLYKSGIKQVKKVKIEELIQGDLNAYPKKTQLLDALRFIVLEVSPSCDHACRKLRVNRILPGVIWPKEHEGKIKKSDYIYTATPLFEINGGQCRLVFDLRYLTSVPQNHLKNRRAFLRVRHELLVDIQSYIARHINRPGVISL